MVRFWKIVKLELSAFPDRLEMKSERTRKDQGRFESFGPEQFRPEVTVSETAQAVSSAGLQGKIRNSVLKL